MRRCLGVVVSLLLVVPAAHGGETYLESRTEFRMREADTGDIVAPLREYLSISLDAIGGGFVSVEAGGWAGTDLAGGEDDADLNYAWVQLAGREGLLRLGRQTVVEGVAADMIDGAYGATRLPFGLSAAAFAGRPVPPDPNEGIGDLVYGGRLAQARPALYEVGLSYIREERGDADAIICDRLGLDLRLTPTAPLLLVGRSEYEVEESEWARHAWRASVALPRGIRLIGEFTWTALDCILAPSSLQIFEALAIGPDEAVTTYGLGADVPLGKGITLSLRADAYGYDVSEDSLSFAGTLEWASGLASAGLSGTRFDGGSPDRSCTFARAWGMTRFGSVSLSADCSFTVLDASVNGTKNAVTASLDGGYDLSRAVSVAGSVEYRSGPAMESEVRGGATLVFRFGSTGRV